MAPPVSATFPVDRSQVSVAPRRSMRTSKQNLTLIQEDSQKEILRKALGSQGPPRASSNISREQTRSRSRSGISCYVDIAALSKQLPLPPLVGSEEVGSPSSVCHFDLTSRGTSWGASRQFLAPPSHSLFLVLPRQLRQSVVLMVSLRAMMMAMVGPGSVRMAATTRSYAGRGLMLSPLFHSPPWMTGYSVLCVTFIPSQINIKRLSHIRRAHPGVTLSDAFIALLSAARCSKGLSYYKAAGLSAHESVCGRQGRAALVLVALQCKALSSRLVRWLWFGQDDPRGYRLSGALLHPQQQSYSTLSG